ncbi:LysR family transcriptional regulator [Agaribacterium sp. ZY112]|uniref:LysR family transcriptional regulator n=1 Tax=Agaribacterium sp. ZY112 TaxID=3233574 RepID=UPI0035268830
MKSNKMDLNDTRLFAKVAECGGISAAARALELPKSKVSRRISALEQSLNAGLLERTTRAIKLTEAGKLFYQHCKRIVEEADNAEHSIQELLDVPRGILRVSTSISMGQELIAPVLGEFMQAYPEVEIDLQLNNRRVDLTNEGFDLALRVGKLEDSSLIARKLGQGKARLFASPSYLDSAPAIHSVQDLHKQRCLIMSDAVKNKRWLLESIEGAMEISIPSMLSINDFYCLQQAAINGAGIAFIPDYLCREALKQKQLVPVLSEWQSPGFSYYAMYESRRGMTQKMQAFLSFYEKRFNKLR